MSKWVVNVDASLEFAIASLFAEMLPSTAIVCEPEPWLSPAPGSRVLPPHAARARNETRIARRMAPSSITPRRGAMGQTAAHVAYA
jgi:hypothetical protein